MSLKAGMHLAKSCPWSNWRQKKLATNFTNYTKLSSIERIMR